MARHWSKRVRTTAGDPSVSSILRNEAGTGRRPFGSIRCSKAPLNTSPTFPHFFPHFHTALAFECENRDFGGTPPRDWGAFDHALVSNRVSRCRRSRKEDFSERSQGSLFRVVRTNRRSRSSTDHGGVSGYRSR